MLRFLFAAAVIVALAGLVWSDEPTETSTGTFEPPVKLVAGEAPIDVEVGHADPFVVDLNGDGKLDLLVGQFGGGKLKFFANVGTNEAPKLADQGFVKAGEAELNVPSG